jgi:quinol monooxygenase YgiN
MRSAAPSRERRFGFVEVHAQSAPEGEARMILITGSVTIAEENRTAFLEAAIRHVSLSREELGCISHGVHEDMMAPGTFVFVERWRDMAAVQEHFAKPYSRETMMVIRELALRSSGVEIHDIASTRVV